MRRAFILLNDFRALKRFAFNTVFRRDGKLWVLMDSFESSIMTLYEGVSLAHLPLNVKLNVNRALQRRVNKVNITKVSLHGGHTT